jgi:hypothetical protein
MERRWRNEPAPADLLKLAQEAVANGAPIQRLKPDTVRVRS